MTLTPGTKLGPYEIVAPLGAGGMGEVYRARDTRLGREVAVKVLPLHLSANEEVRARFEREAKTVSSLNHPNICTLFDVGREGDTDYLVMELVDGETLADRLRRGPLPAPELLRVGVQIADALDRAHRAGVIHRDLKPGNVMLTRSGAKLMDFGLARAAALAATGGSSLSGLTQSPTVAQPLTAEGSIVGTFQYMAPEQLEGREADVRSDVWALGCVLYEMATGKRAFEGRSQATLIAAIIGSQPAPVGEAPSGAAAGNAPPSGLDRLIRTCLAKDPEERNQTAHDVKLQLQWIAENAGLSAVSAAPSGATATPAPVRRGSSRVAWGVAALAVLGAAAFAAWAWPRLGARPEAFRFKPEVNEPGIVDPNWPRVSPDGRALVFEATDTTGVQRAWLLKLDDTRPTPITGSEKLSRAYWSPDSREIAFVVDQKIMRLPVAGGTPRIVCPAPGGSDLSWGAKGHILMDGNTADSLRVVPAGGGELRPATRIDRARKEVASAWPSFLPDGEHFLFIGLLPDGSGDIRLGRLGSLDSKVLGKSDGRAEWAPGDWVLFVRGSSLLAQKLDLGAGKLTGEPITLADDLRVGGASGNFSVSRTGVLAMQRGAVLAGLELQVASRSGTFTGPALATGTLGNPHFSPDGRRVLYEHKQPGAVWGEVSVYDLERGTNTPLTFTGGRAVRSQWSPDGRRFAYTRVAPIGKVDLMIGASDGLGGQDSIAAPANGAYLSQWAAAGNRLVTYSNDRDVRVVPADGPDRTLRPLLGPDLRMTQGAISPDGRWLAGTVVGAGDFNVFVQSLTGTPGRWQISTAPGGAKPVWTKGGRELVYEGADGKLMAVDIDTRDGFHPGTPKVLFQLPLPSFSREIATWGADADGARFLVISPERGGGPARSMEIVTRFGSLVEGH